MRWTDRIPALLVALAILTLAACGDEPEVERQRFLALGTHIEVQTAGAETDRAQEAIRLVREDLETLHAGLHPWEAGALARVNEMLAATGEFTADPGTLEALAVSRPLYQDSDGLFNPALGKLADAWGFHQETPDGPPPDDEAIQDILDAEPSPEDIEVDGVRMTNDNPEVQLDFGGVAKGMGVDHAVKLLREQGVENAIVNAGGDLRAYGDRGDRPWRVGIRDPRGEDVLAGLTIEGDEAVFTSGDYERHYEHDGKRYHHLLDPRTGRPARGVTSVTVIHDEGATADAAATALFVADDDQWPRIAKQMGIEAVLRVDDEGTLHMTPAMAERLELEKDGATTRTVELP
ncbi:MAG: FAD:protein FMN transferase [Thiohalospira sp.]